MHSSRLQTIYKNKIRIYYKNKTVNCFQSETPVTAVQELSGFNYSTRIMYENAQILYLFT